MQDHYIALHRLDVRFCFPGSTDQQIAILIESHPLWQEEPSSRGHERGLHFAPAILTAIFHDGIICLYNRRLRHIVIHRNGRDLLIVTWTIGYRSACRQKVVDHVYGSAVA